MDIGKVLDELRQELQQIDEAILSLERMLVGTGKRRGRPPAWMAPVKEAAPVKKRAPKSKSRSQNA